MKRLIIALACLTATGAVAAGAPGSSVMSDADYYAAYRSNLSNKIDALPQGAQCVADDKLRLAVFDDALECVRRAAIELEPSGETIPEVMAKAMAVCSIPRANLDRYYEKVCVYPTEEDRRIAYDAAIITIEETSASGAFSRRAAKLVGTARPAPPEPRERPPFL